MVVARVSAIGAPTHWRAHRPIRRRDPDLRRRDEFRVRPRSSKGRRPDPGTVPSDRQAPLVLIVSGHLRLAPGRRDAFVAAGHEAMTLARASPGCLEFVLAADPLDEDRVVILERWESKEELLAFRGDGPSDGQMGDVVEGAVQRYEIASVGPV